MVKEQVLDMLEEICEDDSENRRDIWFKYSADRSNI